MFSGGSTLILFSLMTILGSGCGHQKTATVTLQTGFEAKEAPQNLMARFFTQKVASVNKMCVQSQIFAAAGPHTDDNGTFSLSSYPVQLTTPLDANVDGDFSNGALGWLQASQFGTISIPVPTGVPVDIGIIGALSAPVEVAGDGTCPLLDSSTGFPNPSYSVLGHVLTTVSANTVVPINIWIANGAQPIASPAPGSTCDGNSDKYSQQCPNQNFDRVSCTGSNCSTIFYAQFDYFYGANGGQHITQLLPLSATGSVYIPDVSPLDVTLIGGAPTAAYEKVHVKNGSTSISGSNYFKNMGTGAVDQNTQLILVGGSGYATTTATPSVSGTVSTLAGSGSAGSQDGIGSAATFYAPDGLVADPSGNIYVSDSGNNTIRKITPAGNVILFAGTAGTHGSSDGTGTAAKFFGPVGIAVDSSGNLYVADSNNNTIRKISSAGVVSTIAGSAGSTGSSDGTGSSARFNYPTGVAVDPNGNIFVADSGNSTIRKITSSGVVSTLAGTANSTGSADGTGSVARFNQPYGIAIDSTGILYVGDTSNNTVRKITPTGVVTTLAGEAGVSGSSDGVGTAARFNGLDGVAVDSAGNVYVADTLNQTIRKINPAGNVTTIAGAAGIIGSSIGSSAQARFSGPQNVAVDSTGAVYVADSNNNVIRKIKQ